ncbi:MAG: tetratricopeptide repeat protein [Beijerinckiaceae bacterium]
MPILPSRRYLAIALLPLLGACQTTDLSSALTGDTRSVTASTGGAVDSASRPKGGDEDLRLGKEHFRNANYGLAEKHFRAAVEQSQDSLEPLLGLAASYDQLGRFDLSDRAYKEVFRISGSNAAALNNRGYSYFLRRDFKRARADFQLALRKDPENAMAKRNMEMLGRRG